MAQSSFLLPFREKKTNNKISNIAVSIYVIVTLVLILISKTLWDILFIYTISLIFLLALRARFFKSLKVVITASLLIFFIGLSSLFLMKGEIIYQLHIGKWTIDFYDEAVFRAIFIWVRGISSVSIITLSTTIFTVQEFIESLRSLFIPNIIVTFILLILRYTPMLFQQGREVRISQELRGVTIAPLGRKFTAVTARIGGTLIRSIRKGTDVYEAMVLRGLENDELVKRAKINWLDWLILPILAGLLSLIAGGILSGLIN